MGLLGHGLENITGSSFEQLLQEHIFAPLNMHNTGVELTPSLKKGLVQGFNAEGQASGVWNFNALAGAGAVYSTAEDMLKFIRATLQAGSDAQRRFEKMVQPQYAGKSGIGWMRPSILEKYMGNKNYYWHNGLVGGYASYIAISPIENAGVVVLSSRAIDASILGVLVTRQLRTQSWAK